MNEIYLYNYRAKLSNKAYFKQIHKLHFDFQGKKSKMASVSHFFCAMVAILGTLFQGAALLSPTWRRYEARGSPLKNLPSVMVYEFLDEWNGCK